VSPFSQSNNFVTIFLPSMFDLILLHQEVFGFMLNAHNLLKSLVFLSWTLAIIYIYIYIIVSLLHTQMSVNILIHPTLWHSYELFSGLLCYLALFYAVHTLVIVQTSIIFFILLNSPLEFLVVLPSIFRFSFTPFGCSTHIWGHLLNASCHLFSNVVCVSF
jgi:hypothetical protein